MADDDEAMRLLVEAILTDAGHEAIPAGDGAEAWAAYEREHPPLVLLDWQMPKLSGIEVCERIRAAEATRDAYIVRW